MTAYETRDYDLALLIILVIFCWPAALIYYLTRPMVTRYQGVSPQYPSQNQPYPSRYCPQCGCTITENERFCSNCGKQLS